MPDAIRSQRPKLLDDVRQVLRLHYYSMHTERSYVEWIVQFIWFHGRRSCEALFPAEPKIEAFLTGLAVHGHVVAAPQNQAMNALVFLYTRVLNHALPGRIDAVRADKKVNAPVIMTREEGAAAISLMDGTTQLVAKLLDGSGLRLTEAVRLRGKDLEVQMKPLAVRSGAGDKGRCTTSPATLTPLLQNRPAGVKTRHQPDLAAGHGEVYLPPALARNTPMPPRHRGGRLSSPPGTAPSTRVPGAPVALTWTPASSTKPSKGGSPCRSDKAYQRPHLSPFLRHSPAPTRHRHPHHSAPARAQRSCHHHDLHPHSAARQPGSPSPLEDLGA